MHNQSHTTPMSSALPSGTSYVVWSESSTQQQSAAGSDHQSTDFQHPTVRSPSCPNLLMACILTNPRPRTLHNSHRRLLPARPSRDPPRHRRRRRPPIPVRRLHPRKRRPAEVEETVCARDCCYYDLASRCDGCRRVSALESGES